MSTDDTRVALWDAINRYVQACGGDPSSHVYGNTPRQHAVAEVEASVTRARAESRSAALAEAVR
ncbi:MAG: hypothetical protein Q8S13_05955, partial [Dehalococcoidia bacterium]|nr:hypothetical protein [Dehalococcoidia bacterium]